METSSRQRAQPRPGTQSLRHRVASSFLSNGSNPRAEDFGNPQPRPMGSWKTTGPSGSTQQAGSSVMAGRKLFNRTQNPSRMGSNTTRSFSDVPANTPGKIFASSSFRSGLQNGNNSKFSFSPRIPPNIIRESFPTVTPGRSFRGSSVDISGRAMSKTSGSNLFQMRITSPPPELDGEELAKQVPENSNRVGSIYADEFLSHLVPPELDDLQRRQFLCILDLRRLKYAATEIFAKKDWRVNIMNFAKEYEKSRSLIMLRYGLYEFKTVPASRDLLKKWKQENNVPDEDEEMADGPAPKSNGAPSSFRSSVKRRAEDDLMTDSDSMSFTPSQNKRRNTDREPLAETAAPTSNAGATPFPKKTKRGADLLDEPDENQHNKLQKPKQSTTLSIFEEIANNSPVQRTVSPTKSAAKPMFGDTAASKPQSSLFAQPSGQSLFGAKAKAPGSGSNIFSHLSEQNTPKGSDESEEESDNNVEEEEEEEEAPTKKSKPSTAVGATASSLFGAKPSVTFGDSSSTGFALNKGSNLFDRMTKASDSEVVKTTEAEPPQDKTWNPNTPIKFGTSSGQSSTPMFGMSTAQPSSIFAKPSETPAFGTQTKDFANDTSKPATTSLFGQTAKPSEPSSNLFGNTSSTPLFGKPEGKPSNTSAAPSTPSLFGAQAATSTTPFGKPAETPATQDQTKSIFGGLNTPATTQSSAPSLFGTASEKPVSSLFGATNGDKPTAAPTLFGAKSTTEEKKESAPKRKKADDTTEDQPAKKFTFGGPAPTPAAAPPPKTAAAANGATDAASVFGAVETGKKTFSFGAAPATPAASVTPAPAPVSLFGNATTAQNEPAKAQPSIFASSTTPSTGFKFGSESSAPSTNPPSNLFGAPANNNAFNTNQGSGFSFGSTAAPTNNSFTFNAGGGDSSFNNPFAKDGNTSQPPSFDFGVSSSQAAPSAFQFGGNTPAAPASSFTFGGSSQPSNDAPAQSNNLFGGGAPNGGSSMFSFGGTSQQSQPAAPSLFSSQPANAAQGIFASQLAVPPPGSSTGTNTPLFGGASSLATTPATGTPEPEATKKDSTNETADEDGAPQDQQVSLTDGGPGEEDEEVVHEVRAKALRHVPPNPDDDDGEKGKKNTPWRTEGLGPLRVLKHKTTGAVRILLRTEPSGKVAMNKLVLPSFEYKVDKGAKWIKMIAAKDDGKGLETWMLQVRNNEFAVKLAAALEEHKVANKKED